MDTPVSMTDRPILSPETQATVLASLARMGLLPAGTTATLTPLTGGVSSLILRVDAGSRSFCFKQALPQLRTAQQWLAPVERARAEADFLRLAADILPDQTPTLLAWDHQGLALALSYLPPEHYCNWKNLLRDGEIECAHAAAVGLLLARLHNASAHRADLAEQFAHHDDFHALRLDPYLLATARAHPDLAGTLEKLASTTASTRIALMHGDYSPKNILIGPTANTGHASPVILDAETACYGDPAFDAAFCLNHLLLKCLWQPQWQACYLSAFTALSETYLQTIRFEQRSTLEARIAALLPGLLMARVDGKSPVEYLQQETQRDRVRAAAIPLLQQPLPTLAATALHWQRQLAELSPQALQQPSQQPFQQSQPPSQQLSQQES